jgi:hypothetical protein
MSLKNTLSDSVRSIHLKLGMAEKKRRFSPVKFAQFRKAIAFKWLASGPTQYLPIAPVIPTHWEINTNSSPTGLNTSQIASVMYRQLTSDTALSDVLNIKGAASNSPLDLRRLGVDGVFIVLEATRARGVDGL